MCSERVNRTVYSSVEAELRGLRLQEQLPLAFVAPGVSINPLVDSGLVSSLSIVVAKSR